MSALPSLIFQASKLGNRAAILAEMEWAAQLAKDESPVGRIYGLSGGALTATAFALTCAAHREPARWGRAARALADFSDLLRRASHWDIHGLNLFP